MAPALQRKRRIRLEELCRLPPGVASMDSCGQRFEFCPVRDGAPYWADRQCWLGWSPAPASWPVRCTSGVTGI